MCVAGSRAPIGQQTNDVMVRPLGEQRLTQVYPNQSGKNFEDIPALALMLLSLPLSLYFSLFFSPSIDRKMELKKLNRSILVCFLELLDILILNPASPERNTKINNLSILFINMHHLINEYRPHQARETLRVVLERQKSQREDMILQIQRCVCACVCVCVSGPVSPRPNQPFVKWLPAWYCTEELSPLAVFH